MRSLIGHKGAVAAAVFHPDRLYEGMNITGVVGLGEGQITVLQQLGTIDRPLPS